MYDKNNVILKIYTCLETASSTKETVGEFKTCPTRSSHQRKTSLPRNWWWASTCACCGRPRDPGNSTASHDNSAGALLIKHD